MTVFLQAPALGTDILRKLPSFGDMISYYGPFLGLILVLITIICVAQFVWYRKLVKAKNEEIDRLVGRENELNKRLMKFIDSSNKKNK